MKPVAISLLASICLCVVSSFAEPTKPVNEAAVSHQLTNMPMAFTKNMGQWPDSILFRASSGGTTMWFTKDGIYYQFTQRIPQPHAREGGNPEVPDKFSHERDSIEATMIKAQYVGANPRAEVVGLEELDYKCNYFIGNDPAKWHADVPNYAGVTFKEIYPGAEATFRGENGTLACELHGSAEALAKVQTHYVGAPTKEEHGLMVVQTKLGEKKFRGMLPVSESAPPAVPLDPTNSNTLTLAYSTYLGGSGEDKGYAIAVDGSGNAYVTGSTWSLDFPTQTAYQTNSDAYNCFVTKIAAGGGSLVHSTYLGGKRDEEAYSIAVDGQGNEYVTGYTSSDDFPTQAPYQATKRDVGTWDEDAFVTVLSATGNSLVYSTYLGSTLGDMGCGIAVNQNGNAYVTGYAMAADFPLHTPFQATFGGGYFGDAFITKFSVGGNGLVYSTFLGGTRDDQGHAIVVDSAGSAYVTGLTASEDFPTLVPYQSVYETSVDAFVTKLAPSGTSLVYSTYLGGTDSDVGRGIAVDGSGCAYVTGSTQSLDLPTQAPFQATYGGGSYPGGDAFVTKLSATGTNLVYSTYLGGIGHDNGHAIAVDGQGCAYVTGSTWSTNFPTKDPYQAEGWEAAFVTKFSAAGSDLVYSTYLTGNNADAGWGIAVDSSGSAYATGATTSSNFPMQTAYQTYQGNFDAFVAKLSFIPGCCTGTRGNVNLSDIVNVSDLSLLVAYLTVVPPPALPCLDAANVNATGVIDISDLSWLISYLTVLPPPSLPACP